MAAATQNRNTGERRGGREVYPLTDNVHIYLGTMVVLDAAGNAKPGVTAVGLKCVGIAAVGYTGSVGNSAFAPMIPGKDIDNTQAGHAAGAFSVETRRGVFKFANSGGDPVVAGDIGKPCFVVDDSTVSHSDGGATQSVAGRVEQLDPDGGVWVNFDQQAALAS